MFEIEDINIKSLYNILKSFYTLTSLKIVVYNDKYEEIVSYPNSNSPFCNYIKNNSHFAGKCADCVKFFCENCKAKKDLFINFCHTGLTEAVFPLIDNGDRILGYIMFGQTSQLEGKQELIDHVSNTCKSVCKLEEPAISYLKEIRLRSMNEILSAAEILKTIASYIIIKQFILANRNYPLLFKLNDYIDTHLNKKITTADICKNLYISKTSLYRLIKNELPDGLNNYIMNKKLSYVLKLLYSTNYNLTQIANEIGIKDSNYLCKLFKKKFHTTPYAYRKKFK